MLQRGPSIKSRIISVNVATSVKSEQLISEYYHLGVVVHVFEQAVCQKLLRVRLGKITQSVFTTTSYNGLCSKPSSR